MIVDMSTHCIFAQESYCLLGFRTVDEGHSRSIRLAIENKTIQ